MSLELKDMGTRDVYKISFNRREGQCLLFLIYVTLNSILILPKRKKKLGALS